MRAGAYFAAAPGYLNGGRQFLSNRRSNRHIVPVYGKSDRLFTEGLKFEMRRPPFEVPWNLRSTLVHYSAQPEMFLSLKLR
jgi:hypothetical protein